MGKPPAARQSPIDQLPDYLDRPDFVNSSIGNELGSVKIECLRKMRLCQRADRVPDRSQTPGRQGRQPDPSCRSTGFIPLPLVAELCEYTAHGMK